MKGLRRGYVAAWLMVVAALILLHAVHLRADFPNNSPWRFDWAKYTDEGWYADAAVRARLLGQWYLPGDFNPGVTVPVWPAAEWAVFGLTGVSIEAARALAVILFFANLGLSYLLVRTRWPRWAGLLAVTLLAASPFLYGFSRLAILEPALMTLTLIALNVAARIGRWRHPLFASAAVGLFYALMMLTKTTAAFLLPAVGWALASGLRRGGLPLRTIVRSCGMAAAAAAAVYGGWLLLVAHAGLMAEYHYFLFINKYPKPPSRLWPLFSLYWSFHGALWVDRLLVPLAGVTIIGTALARRAAWARELLLDPVFGAAFFGIIGCILFMTYQNHPQPRYFAVVAYFAFIVVAIGAAAAWRGDVAARRFAVTIVVFATIGAAIGTAQIIRYAMRPQYTWVNAAQALTQYVDEHPNGRRLLLSISGDEITLMTHLPSICDDFGTVNLPARLDRYQPGWYAAWNDLDPGTLADLHTRYSLEQVAGFPALDDPERNVLVLFKLHRLPGGQIRKYAPELSQPMPEDVILVPIE